MDSEFKVVRRVPRSVVMSADNKYKLIHGIKKQIARECVERVMEKMDFVEEQDHMNDEYIIAGRVHIMSHAEATAGNSFASAAAAPPFIPSKFSAKQWEDLEKSMGPNYMTATQIAMQREEAAKRLSAQAEKLAMKLTPEDMFKALVDPPRFGASSTIVAPQTKILAEKVTARKGRKHWHGTTPCLTQTGELIMSKQFWETGSQFDGESAEIRKLPPITVLVDGDIVAYRCAATCDGRHYTVDGQRFGYKKDAVSYADKKGIPNSDIELAFDPEPVDAALHNIGVTMDNIRNYFIYEKKMNPNIKTFLSDSTNFRYELYPEYKKSRKTQRKPHWIKECKEHLAKQFNAFLFENYEADDLIGITVEGIRGKEVPVCIASCDKDFTQLGGGHVWQYDFTTGKSWSVTKEEALRYFYKQILIGDKSDDIPGLHKVGSQTALKILAGSVEERDMYNAVVLEYKNREELTTEQAVEAVTLRGRLLWLTRSEDELWQPPPPRKKEE